MGDPLHTINKRGQRLFPPCKDSLPSDHRGKGGVGGGYIQGNTTWLRDKGQPPICLTLKQMMVMKPYRPCLFRKQDISNIGPLPGLLWVLKTAHLQDLLYQGPETESLAGVLGTTGDFRTRSPVCAGNRVAALRPHQHLWEP